MTSTVRGFSGQPSPSQDVSTRFVNITTPSYYDNVIDDFIPIPFVYNNGELDIHLQDNVFNDLIDSGDYPLEFSERLVRKMGGLRQVTTIGPNFRTYLRNFLATSGPIPTIPGDITNISVHIPAHVTKIQIPVKSAIDNFPFDVSGNMTQIGVFSISSVPPAGDNQLSNGSEADNWSTCWVFQTPLTIGFKADGVQFYLKLQTTFTKNLPFSAGP